MYAIVRYCACMTDAGRDADPASDPAWLCSGALSPVRHPLAIMTAAPLLHQLYTPHSAQRTGHSACRLPLTRPWCGAVPLPGAGLMLGLGIWGVLEGAERQKEHNMDIAAAGVLWCCGVGWGGMLWEATDSMGCTDFVLVLKDLLLKQGILPAWPWPTRSPMHESMVVSEP